MADHVSGEQRFTRDPAAPGGAPTARGRRANERNTGLYWLFVIPLVATLLPSLYNKLSPELFGIPFFYWYQMAWVPLTVLLTVFVYRRTKGDA
jgi:uncharacterized membrane protein